MKLFIISCLIAVCTAAIPSVPNIPSTFCADGEIEYHQAEMTRFGKFMICRDQTKQVEMQIATYMNNENDQEVAETLLRYDTTPNHMAYYIRGDVKNEHCAPATRNVTSKLPPFFDWVKLATYEGITRIREITYDLWGLTVADIRLELAVPLTNPNLPAFYNRLESEDFVKYSFQTFNTTTPDPSRFVIPKICTQP